MKIIVASAVSLAMSAAAMPGVAGAAPAEVALIHSNPVLGVTAENVASLGALVEQALKHGANIVVTPELATTGFSITSAQVLGDLGFTYPYPQLNPIRDLAIQHHGYVFVAIAEVTPAQVAYNTVVAFGPSGLIETQQKRGLSGWHDRGILPFDVIPTPYGDLSTMICSDSYLPDWVRIATRKGADIILLPANWWGRFGQEEIWQTRARENGVWFFTANRWGTEVDNRFGAPFTYFMNDAPSAFIGPDGTIDLLHRAEDDAVPHDTILYHHVNVPPNRIGTTENPVYSVNFREPEAYGAIGNQYYRRDLGYEPAPGLPPEGALRVATMAYKPAASPQANMANLKSIWATHSTGADVLVLPALGVSAVPVLSSQPSWPSKGQWPALQAFVDENGISLLVTTVLEHTPSATRESLLIMQAGAAPELQGQIHDALLTRGTGAAPFVIDLPSARVGVLTGRDALFPETGTALAKAGIDLLLISSSVGVTLPALAANPSNYVWDIDSLHRLWRVRTNEVVHVAASDWTGNGAIVENGGGFVSGEDDVDATHPFAMRSLDTSLVRFKFLNAYYSFDLETLLDP